MVRLLLFVVPVLLTACAGSAPAPAKSAAPTVTTTTPPTATLPTATVVPGTATVAPVTATLPPPTATPVPPTATPVPPTATAVPPTATPKPQMPAEVRTYLQFVQDQGTAIAGALNNLADLSQQANTRPAVINSNQWRGQVVNVLSGMQQTARAIRGYDGPIPADVQPTQATMLSIADDLDYIAVEFATGIDGSAAHLQNAGSRMSTMAAKTPEITKQVQAIAAKYPG